MRFNYRIELNGKIVGYCVASNDENAMTFAESRFGSYIWPNNILAVYEED